MSTPRVLALYALGAVGLLWPALLQPGLRVPGAERSDLWNSLWSIWYVQRSLASGRAPLHTDLLGFPDGGSLVVADPLNALLGTPMVPLLGLPATYLVLILAHLVFSGWAAHRLTEAVVGEGTSTAWLAGFCYQVTPVIVS